MLDASTAGQARLTKVTKRHIFCDSNRNFDAVGGADVIPDERLAVYAIEQYPDGCGGSCNRICADSRTRALAARRRAARKPPVFENAHPITSPSREAVACSLPF